MPRDYLNRKTVKGKQYVYFRSPDGKLTSLPADETSTDFKRAYQTCLKSIQQQPVIRLAKRVGWQPPQLGSIAMAISRYKESTDFIRLKPGTKAAYGKSLDDLGERIGAALLCDLDTDAIDIHSEDIAKEFGDSVADRHVRLLSILWQVCKKYPEFGIKGKPSPTADAQIRYSVKQPQRPWTDEQQNKFMQTAPDYLKLAKLLLHFSGQRGGDCVKMQWTDFDGKGLWVTPEKTDGDPDPLPNYHLCPKPLLDALLAAPRTAETILTNSRGQRWHAAMGLSHAIRDHLIKIGLAENGRRSITMHGLRKNAASDVAALLVGTAGVKTVTGHRSNEMADFYSQHASKRAMNEVVVSKWNESLEEKDNAVKRRQRGMRRVK